MRALRLYIRSLIREMKEEAAKKADDLLTEPDEVQEREEASTDEVGVAAIAGATTPLGTGPTYPSGAKRKKKKLPKGWQKSN